MVMNTVWSDFLTAHGATLTDGQVQHFGDAAAELAMTTDSDILADLSHLGLLAVTGEDAATFLQGQLTNDVRLLDGSNSQYAGYCTAKGRLLATLMLWKHADTYYLQLNGAIAPAIMKRLSMFILRSKVKISSADQSNSGQIRFGIAGNGASTMLAEIFPDIPRQPHQIIFHDDTTLLRLPGIAPRFEIIAPSVAAPALWEKLSQKLKPIGTSRWEWLDIRAGIPQVTAATQEAFVPQMLNLDLLDGINFKKGCYTGQEIVARTHYLGKVKRRAQLAHIDSQQIPQAGEDVFGSGTTEPVGKIVNVAAAPTGGFDLLVEIRMEVIEAGAIHWQAQDGPILELLALPYGF
jgi:hypothetical protein